MLLLLATARLLADSALVAVVGSYDCCLHTITDGIAESSKLKWNLLFVVDSEMGIAGILAMLIPVPILLTDTDTY